MVDIIYILQCQHGCYYIGQEKKKLIIKRLRQHRDGKHPDCKWTNKHHGVTLITSFVMEYPQQATVETEKWMKFKGIKKVRGGDYGSVLLTPYESRRIRRKFKWKVNSCRKCGRTDHIITNCNHSTFENGDHFSDNEDEDSDDGVAEVGLSYSYSTKELDERPTPGMTWHSIPP